MSSTPPESIQPLRGITVIDVSQSLAGPFCAQVLAEMGAEVIKVERPGSGDSARAWGPPFWDDEGTIFLSANRNKRSIALDLKTEAGLRILFQLLERADVLVESFRAGGAEALGLGWEAVHAHNPRLIYCSVTAFGTRGPLRERPGYDPLAQAFSGLMSVTGHPGQAPARVGTSAIDFGTGVWGAIGVLGALRERDRSGRGSHVGTSLYDTALSLMGYHLLGYLATGEAPGPQGSGLPMIAPYEALPTADGQLMLAAGTDALFVAACGALGRPDLADDTRFSDNAGRVRHRDVLIEALTEATRQETTDRLVERLQAVGVPCAPIRTVDQVAADAQTQATGMLEAMVHPHIPDYRSVALPVEWDGRRPAARRAPPRLGEHTDEVLRELGHSDAEITALADEGVIER